jgi:hypothetical protein
MGRRIFFIGIGLLVTITFACTPLSSDYRAQGLKYTQRAFDYYEETPDLHRVIELEKVRIHIIGSRKFFQWEKAKSEGSATIAYATPKNEIFLFGKKVGNKIVVNQAVLGHELNHLLNFRDMEIADPDELNEIESRHYNELWSLRLHQYFQNSKAEE